jgi:hypothetical protein
MPRLTKKAPKSAKKARMKGEMHKFKKGSLKSSSGKKVKSRKQAIAIGLSESGQSKKSKKKSSKKKSSADSKPRNLATDKTPKRKASNRRKRNIGR